MVWNLGIAKDFIDIGKRDGDAIGSTGRYLASRRDIPGEKFYIATSDTSPYYTFGGTQAAIDRLTLFADARTQVGPVVDPVGLPSFTAAPPFALFMMRYSWNSVSTTLADRYPRGRLRNVTPDGTRVVLEVPS